MTGENQSTQSKICLSVTLSTTNPTQIGLGSNLGHRSERVANNYLGHFTPHPTTINSVTFSLFQVYISTDCSNSRFEAIKTDTYKHLACTNQQFESTKHNNYPICLQMSLVSKSGPKPRSRSPPKYVTYSREGFKPYWPTKRSHASSHDSFCITVPNTITVTVMQHEIHTKPQHRHCPT